MRERPCGQLMVWPRNGKTYAGTSGALEQGLNSLSDRTARVFSDPSDEPSNAAALTSSVLLQVTEALSLRIWISSQRYPTQVLHRISCMQLPSSHPERSAMRWLDGQLASIPRLACTSTPQIKLGTPGPHRLRPRRRSRQIRPGRLFVRSVQCGGTPGGGTVVTVGHGHGQAFRAAQSGAAVRRGF